MAADRIPLSNTVNTRDLGGYPVGGNRFTKSGAFLRSDALTCVADSDQAILNANNVETLIDLRTESEVIRRPCPLAGNPMFAYHNCPIHSGEFPPDPLAVPYVYLEIASKHQVICDVFRRISDAPGGVLFFCGAGKDRTGVIAALILLLAGVGDADIISDYMRSGAYLREVIAKWEESHPDFPPGVDAPRVAYMETFLALFREKYGSIQGYFSEIGLDVRQIAGIKARIAD